MSRKRRRSPQEIVGSAVLDVCDNLVLVNCQPPVKLPTALCRSSDKFNGMIGRYMKCERKYIGAGMHCILELPSHDIPAPTWEFIGMLIQFKILPPGYLLLPNAIDDMLYFFNLYRIKISYVLTPLQLEAFNRQVCELIKRGIHFNRILGPRCNPMYFNYLCTLIATAIEDSPEHQKKSILDCMTPPMLAVYTAKKRHIISYVCFES